MADIIAAISTANAPAAIGILRLSGPGCAQVAGRIFAPARGGTLSGCPDRRLCLGTLRDSAGRVIDRCMAVYSRAPHTYTGEDTVELHCHGSPAVLAAGLEALFAAGARQALPGEFTKRAFLSGRMDLTQAEAVIDLIEAETAEAAANAAAQVGGAVRSRIEAVSDSLTGILAHFHAVLDYPDEDIDPFELARYRAQLGHARAALAELAGTYARGQLLRGGVRTVLLGRPNAGKSSLLNALAGFERVIVTPIAGTTRDTVEERVRVGGVLLRLTDTAGIRDTAEPIEQLGVQRSIEAAQGAQLALFLCDASTPLNEEDARAIRAAQSAGQAIGILNKCDLPAVIQDLPFDTVLRLSAKTGEGLAALEAEIARRFGAQPEQEETLLTNARQAGAVRQAAAALERAVSALDGGVTADAVLTDVELALTSLGEITGRVVRDEVLTQIFSRFCVGK